MSNQNFVWQQKNIFNHFQIDKFYPTRVSTDIQGEKRLTQGKISTFHKGFKLTKGEAQFPTDFEIIDKKFDDQTGHFVLKGRLRDNDDHEYFLALETDSGESYIKCGYNGKGDWVEIEIRQTIQAQSNFNIYEGRVRALRDPDTYCLVDAEDSYIFCKGNIGDRVYIAMKTFPL